jgi:hypothetical protein
MGLYIQTEQPRGKAQQLVLAYNATPLPSCPVDFGTIPEDKALICVVENGGFDAAALIPDAREMDDFSVNDTTGRYRTWLLMDKPLAHRLAGYKG